jgi:lipopolysaccharide transport system ATP-binding protein
MATAIKVENLSKAYQIGQIGTGTISRDLERWWLTKVRGKEDPFLKIGETNDRAVKGESDIVWSLKDINFEIEQGEAVGIIGRNGAGKSTLLKVLSEITSPTTGKINIKGRVASLLEVGTGFHPELTGRENIFLNGAILGMRKKEIHRQLDAIIDFSGVERYIDTPVKKYSSGMYVRLAFAVAAHLESEILVVDEVLAVGDAEFQKKCLGKMGDISKGEGRTILFVSHNMAAIKNLCSYGILLENGIIKSKGAINNVLNDYLSYNSKRTLVNLENREDRIGNGVLQFTEISFLNNKGHHQKTFLSGEEVNILLKYKTSENVSLKNVSISLAFNNNLDTQIAMLGNEISNEIFEEVLGEGVVICKIPKIQLVSGNYNLNLFSKVGDNISDWIMNTCSLIIEKGDYYKTGRNLDSEQSIFLMDYSFKMQKI